MTYTALDRAQPTDSNRGARDRLYDLVCKKMGISKPPPYDDAVNEKDHLIDPAVVRKAVVIAVSIVLDTLSPYNNRENSTAEHPLAGKEDTKLSPKEGELQQGVETTNLQALKEFGDSVEEKLKSSEETSDVFNKAVSLAVSLAHDICKASQKGVAPEEIKEALQQKAQALPKKGDIFSPQPNQEKALETPDLSEIPLYQSRRGRRPEMMPLDFLKTHYGQWLSAYDAKQDSVFQNQIRAHDPDLIKGIDNQLRREGKGRKVSDIVKTRSARVDRELEDTDPEYLRKAHREASRLDMASKRRELKANRPPKHR